MLYWLGDELIGFNLLFVGADRVIDKFIGMRYPLAREHNLYVLSWMTNVRFCLERGITKLQTGQTAYAAKLRLGSRLEKSWMCFKHRGRVINTVFRTFGPLIAFDRRIPIWLPSPRNNNAGKSTIIMQGRSRSTQGSKADCLRGMTGGAQRRQPGF